MYSAPSVMPSFCCDIVHTEHSCAPLTTVLQCTVLPVFVSGFQSASVSLPPTSPCYHVIYSRSGFQPQCRTDWMSMESWDCPAHDLYLHSPDDEAQFLHLWPIPSHQFFIHSSYSLDWKQSRLTS